jgi:hypothetical protein
MSIPSSFRQTHSSAIFPSRGKSACLWLGPISGSHQGQRPQRLHRLEASLQVKTGRIHGCTRTLRKEVRFSLAPRAPSIHGRSGRKTSPGPMSALKLLRKFRTMSSWENDAIDPKPKSRAAVNGRCYVAKYAASQNMYCTKPLRGSGACGLYAPDNSNTAP